MQNSTKKWTDIQGLPAVAIDTGKKVGTLDDFYFDPQTGEIPAFLIKTSLFGRRALKASILNAIGVDALTFTEENALIKESDDDALQTKPSGKSLLNHRVLSEGGTLVGAIGNLLLDISSNPPSPSTARIAAFELTGGLRELFTGHYPTISADKVMRYGQDVIVISDAVAQSL